MDLWSGNGRNSLYFLYLVLFNCYCRWQALCNLEKLQTTWKWLNSMLLNVIIIYWYLILLWHFKLQLRLPIQPISYLLSYVYIYATLLPNPLTQTISPLFLRLKDDAKCLLFKLQKMYYYIIIINTTISYIFRVFKYILIIINYT